MMKWISFESTKLALQVRVLLETPTILILLSPLDRFDTQTITYAFAIKTVSRGQGPNRSLREQNRQVIRVMVTPTGDGSTNKLNRQSSGQKRQRIGARECGFDSHFKNLAHRWGIFGRIVYPAKTRPRRGREMGSSPIATAKQLKGGKHNGT